MTYLSILISNKLHFFITSQFKSQKRISLCLTQILRKRFPRKYAVSVADIRQLSPMPPFLQATALSIMEDGFPARAEKAEIERTIKTKKFFPIIHFSVCAFKQRLRKVRCLLPRYSDSSYPHPDAYDCNHSGGLPAPQTRFV